MTDNEIIKALEYCSKQGVTSDCEKCEVPKGCRPYLISQTIDLINRQKAEIGRLRSMNQAKLDTIHDLQEENNWYSETLNTTKVEAIKEFVERLYKLDSLIVCNGTYITDFDDILKLRDEMVGDDE